jgi:hypothetical protein
MTQLSIFARCLLAAGVLWGLLALSWTGFYLLVLS